VYLWWSETNEIERIELPHDPDVISRTHIDIQDDRTDRLEAFIRTIKKEWDATVDFDRNLKRFQHKHKIHPTVMKIVRAAMAKAKEGKHE
jgi:hypothetical protein